VWKDYLAEFMRETEPKPWTRGGQTNRVVFLPAYRNTVRWLSHRHIS